MPMPSNPPPLAERVRAAILTADPKRTAVLSDHEFALVAEVAAMAARLASAEAERERLREERDALRSVAMELRIRYHAAGRRPEECHEMHLLDTALTPRTEADDAKA